jgi:hypothetical protein
MTPIADAIQAHADALQNTPDLSTVARIAAALTMLAQTARRSEWDAATARRTLDEIVENARQDAMMQRANGDVVVDLRAWRGL